MHINFPQPFCVAHRRAGSTPCYCSRLQCSGVLALSCEAMCPLLALGSNRRVDTVPATPAKRRKGCSYPSGASSKPPPDAVEMCGLLGRAPDGRHASGGSGVQVLTITEKKHGSLLGSGITATMSTELGSLPVDETNAQHAARHTTLRPECVRCVYTASRAHLEKSWGSHATQEGDRVRRSVWLAPRPSRLGGDWAVGCVFCAELRQKTADAIADARREGRALVRATRRGSSHADTKWARFEIKVPSQVACRGVRQHAETLQHQRAVRAHFAPDAAHVIEESESANGDRELFRGGVPQVEDWLRAWRSCRTPQSFYAAEANGITDNYIKGSRVAGVGRKAFRSMIRVLALVLRARKLEALRDATAISLMMDDRGSYRLISFKCSRSGVQALTTSGSSRSGAQALTTSGCSRSGVQALTTSGCLAVFRRGGNFADKELADADEDYSLEMSNSIIRGIERICTCATTGRVDTALVQDICRRVRIAVSDGCAAAQKCMRFLAVHHMPNLLWIGRDRAHALRIATSHPLIKEDMFKAWWDDTFADRHALVPDIQNSEEWLAKLELCQKHVLGRSGVQGCGFNAVAKTLHFAKQRFDSLATPQLMFCIMFVAIAMLLAYASTDSRGDSQARSRSKRRLEQMPDHVLTAGLSASYSDEAIRFIRKFDTANHDPALSYSHKVEFLERMHVLFTAGRIWDSIDDTPGAGTTPLAIIWKQARTAKPIYYDHDGKVLHLLRKPSAAQARELNDSVQAVSASMSARVEAELPAEDLGMMFTVFDLMRWYAARLEMSRSERRMYDVLRDQAKTMFRCWRLDMCSGVQELTAMAMKLCVVEESHLKDGTPRDNRVAWSQVLQDTFCDPNDRVTTLLPMLHIYLCAVDSTCGVERDLGALTRVLRTHSGPIDADGTTIAYCTEVLLDGPTEEVEVGVQAGDSQSVLLPTDFSRECAALWTELHGRRFRIYKPGRKPGPKRRWDGTMSAIKKSVKKGMDTLVSRGAPGDDTPTILGLARSSFWRSGDNPARGKGLLGAFDKLTKQKRTDQMKLFCARRMRGNPYAIGDIDPRSKLRRGQALRDSGVAALQPGVPVVQARPSRRRIVVINCCREPLPARNGYQIVDLDVRPTPDSLLSAVKRSDVVALDSPWALDEVPTLSDTMVALFFIIIALGKVVIPRSSWGRCRPEGPPPEAVVQFRPVYNIINSKIVLTSTFAQKHALLNTIVELIARLPGSKWAIANTIADKSVRFESVSDVRSFLFRARRVHHNSRGLLGGKYFDGRE